MVHVKYNSPFRPPLRHSSRTSILLLRRLPHWLNHLLDKSRAQLRHRLTASDRHILQQRRVTHIRSVSIAVNVRGPLATQFPSAVLPRVGGGGEGGIQFRSIGVPSSYIACLELLELLRCAEFVGHCGGFGGGGEEQEGERSACRQKAGLGACGQRIGNCNGATG